MNDKFESLRGPVHVVRISEPNRSAAVLNVLMRTNGDHRDRATRISAAKTRNCYSFFCKAAHTCVRLIPAVATIQKAFISPWNTRWSSTKELSVIVLIPGLPTCTRRMVNNSNSTWKPRWLFREIGILLTMFAVQKTSDAVLARRLCTRSRIAGTGLAVAHE